MRLRWITVLCALVLKVSLIGGLLLLGRDLLHSNYAALEQEDAAGDLVHLCVLLQAQSRELGLTAMDYAARDVTYDYMRRHTPDYENAHLSAATFRAREINLFLLLDEAGHPLLAHSFDTNSEAIRTADIQQLVRAAHRRTVANSSVNGLITLTRGPALVAMRPVLPTNGKGRARGTLIMVRELGPLQVAALSRLADFPVTVSGTSQESAQVASSAQLACSASSIVIVDEDRLLASVCLYDIWRQPGIRLQIEHGRGIWRQGKQTIRALITVLVLGGLLALAVTLWVMETFVVRRVRRLIRLVSNIESEDELSARIRMRGSDELAQLGGHMNAMLQRLQNSQDKLVAAQERLRFEATHDSLTGIWNRGAALRLLDAELDRASREGNSVAVIIFDADHFKRINDHFGHAAGDRALQAIAAAITSNLRSFDVCCRYGGEEFLVIAPACSLEQGTRLAQRILEYCSRSPVNLPEQAFCITLSAGVTAATWRCNADDLIVVADRALYRAKDRGRNRVEVGDLPIHPSARSTRFAPTNVETGAPARSSGA